jgi:polyisoprenoid-binding protein YceI
MSGAMGVRMSAQDAVVHYQVDPEIGRLTVRVSASGLLSVMGHNPTIAVGDYSGEASVAADSLDQASFRMTIQAESLTVTDDISQKDKLEIESRMNQEVLETARYPSIGFESSSITASKIGVNSYTVKALGNVSLHGVSRVQTIVAQVAFDGATLRAFGEFSLRQTDFGIKLVSVAGGALKAKDEVKISFDITARKRE